MLLRHQICLPLHFSFLLLSHDKMQTYQTKPIICVIWPFSLVYFCVPPFSCTTLTEWKCDNNHRHCQYWHKGLQQSTLKFVSISCPWVMPMHSKTSRFEHHLFCISMTQFRSEAREKTYSTTPFVVKKYILHSELCTAIVFCQQNELKTRQSSSSKLNG